MKNNFTNADPLPWPGKGVGGEGLVKEFLKIARPWWSFPRCSRRDLSTSYLGLRLKNPRLFGVATVRGRGDAEAEGGGNKDRAPPGAHFTTVKAMFGLLGLTSTVLVIGMTTRSMSSIGIAPRSTWSPRTRAPAKPTRFLNRNSTGPT